MLKNWKKKTIAILLIFTMTFSNFALVGKTYATDFFGGKDKDPGDTGSSKVEFDAYFKTSQDSKATKNVSSDIKNSDLLVGATVKVKDSGYLKDAKILFGDGKELNFVIKDEVVVENQTEKVEGDSNSPSTEETVIGGELSTDEEVIGGGFTEESNETPVNHETVGEPNTEESANENEEPNESGELVEEDDSVTEIGTTDEPNDEYSSENEPTDEVNEEKSETINLVEENEEVQSFENNQLNLIQLNADEEMKIEFPISYQYKKFVQKSMISKTNKIKFEGVYINDDAEEIKVSKTVDLKLSWEDEREVSTSLEITKYLGFSQDGVNGIILQVLAKVDNSTNDSSLPIKDSLVEISVPEIDGIKPETVSLVAKSLGGTTGKENDEVEFGTDNWNYDSDNNKITIKVENKPELISTQNENDDLIDETAPIEEMYYSESGADSYLITYTYKNVSIGEREITTKLSANLNEFGETKLSSENEFVSSLKDEIGSIVTYTNETTTDSVSKGYTYLNYNNEESKYEIEIDNKLIFNVSYKDIVEGLYYSDVNNQYVSKSGEVFEQNDLYYKTLTLNKQNFTEILGEEGVVTISSDGQVIYTINKDTESNEDGIIEVKFENTVKNIQIETSKPINDGNLIFTTIKAYSNVSYDKNAYKNFDGITINTVGRAKYIYLNDLVDVGNSNMNIKLEDTKTEANLEIGQDSLSTLAMNNNVELKIELNNEDIKSDVYGKSKFQIKLPEYVETVDVTDYNIAYGEGLELGNVQGFVYDGDAYIDIEVNGQQKELSSGIVSNGTNIVLNANIKVDLFAPASEGEFELTYTNDDATNYNDGLNAGRDVVTVSYSAPSGVVSVNSISGYSEDETKTITSVNQGKVQDEIAIYSDKKIAKSELTVMNNEKNDISNISILGRIPFEGVKDITSGEDLGTTLTTKMVSKITPDELNETEFRYYYSENGDATQDLNDSSNGWTEDVSTLDNVKTFLIVPVDSEYKMDSATKLRFTYEYEIPENLEHNAEIYGTFATYYTNNTDVATINDVSEADLVGLVTGEGPQFDIDTTVNKDTVKEYEQLEITTTVTNTGKSTAYDLKITVPFPEYTNYVSSSYDNENIYHSVLNEQVEYSLSALEVNETIKIITLVNVNKSSSGIFELPDVIEDKNGNPINNNTEKETETEIKVYSLLTATDLDTLLKSDEKTVTLKYAEMRVYIDNRVNDPIVFKGCDIKLFVRVQNLTTETLHNVVASAKVPNGFKFAKGTVRGTDGEEFIDISEADYNESTRVVTWKIGDVSPLEIANLIFNMDVEDIDESVTLTEIKLSASAKADGTEEYSSAEMVFKVGRPDLVITQTTSTTNSYVKEGETINYKFLVKNQGSVTAKSVRLVDRIPDGLVAKSISYVSEGLEIKKAVSSKDEVTIGVSIPAGDSLEVNVEAMATSLNGLGEKSVTNNATVLASNVDEIKSNDITHIIESSGNVISATGEVSTGLASSSNDSTVSLSKTYKIKGTAWLDEDRDGMRSENEKLMKNIKATLVDSDNGIIKQTTSTNSKGEYTFTGVKNGNYIVIFDYDTILYTVTVFKKENIAQNVNSDVITTKIEQDGQIRNGAVTEVVNINDVSVSNIDIGLVEALKFDMNLDMGISKITSQTSKETDTKTYDNSKLTKTEFAAKEVDGSRVYIEYTITVKNEGETSGFVKKIVDYVPEGMEFNSGMNQDWFTGNDGLLYTTSLENTELQPGETKTVKLVLSKVLTDENTGTVSNTAEIAEDYNIYGVSDLDSMPGNKAQNEDDFDRTDSYLSIKTGEVFIYISVIITTVILVGFAITIIILKIKDRKLAKGGV